MHTTHRTIWTIGTLFMLTTPLYSQEFKINTDTGGAGQGMVRLAKSESGPAVMVWADAREDASYDVYMQHLTRKGYILAQRLNQKVNDDDRTAGTSQLLPDAAIDGRGRATVVWTDNRSGSYDIMLQRCLANGDTLGGNTLVNTKYEAVTATAPSVASDYEGNVIVVWADDRGGRMDIYAQWYDPSGAALGSNYMINLDTTGVQGYPRIAMNREGAFVVSWMTTDADNRHIWARAFDSYGQSQGPEFRVDQTDGTALPQGWPNIALQAAGDFMIVWEGDDGSGHTDIFGRLYDRNTDPVTETITINDSYGLEDTRHPDVTAYPNHSYGVVYRTNRLVQHLLEFRMVYSDGSFADAAKVITTQSDNQHQPAVVSDIFQNTLVAWSDNRNGDGDIYARLLYAYWPTHTISGNGFDGLVPLSWDPPFGYTDLESYEIERSDAPGGPYSLVATIDAAARPLGNMMLDWLDTSVENGKTYYYRISMDHPESSGGAWLASGRPRAGGHRLASGWNRTVPTIDGSVEPGEWDDAVSMDIGGTAAEYPVTLYIKNDYRTLYLALDDPNDLRLEPGTVFGLLLDRDNSGTWPETPGDEGSWLFSPSNAQFIPYYGTYPVGLNAGAAQTAGNVSYAFSNSGGRGQLEIALTLVTGDVAPILSGTLGGAFWYTDPGTDYPHQYGNTGMWPKGALWEAAESLGKLSLAMAGDTLQDHAWTMAGHDRARTSWAADETDLRPPFDSTLYVATSGGVPERISVYDNTLYISLGHSIGIPNRLLSMRLDNLANNWNFDIPGSDASMGNQAAAGPFRVFVGGQGGVGLHALNRQHGYEEWHRPIGSLFNQPAILDGDRVYVSDDSLFCMQSDDGTLLWQYDLHGYWNLPPAIDDLYVYQATQDSLIALNKYDGMPVWSRKKTGLMSVCLDDEYVYTYSHASIMAIDKSTGALIWAASVTEQDTIEGVNKLALDSQRLVFSINTNASDKGELLCFDKTGGSVLWRHQFDTEFVNPPSIANDIVYCIDLDAVQNEGTVYAFDAASGDVLFTDASRSFRGQVIIADHALFVADGYGFQIYRNSGTTAVAGQSAAPRSFTLDQNYPNPFNPETAIAYTLPAGAEVTVTIFDIGGRAVRSWDRGLQQAGTHQVRWNGMTGAGLPAASGIYFCRVTAASGGSRQSRSMKMVLVK